MLVRIGFIVAIVAALAVGGINLVQLKHKLDLTIAERDQLHADLDKETEAKAKAQQLASDTQAKLDKTSEELTATKDDRDKQAALAEEQGRRVAAVNEVLEKTQKERDTLKSELAEWHQLTPSVAQVKAVLGSLQNVSKERDQIATQKQDLLKRVAALERRLRVVLGVDPDTPPDLPVDLRGKVLVSDHKYEFVLLDIGEKQGVLEDGQLLVHRGGELIAKVKVRSVQPDRSIAYVMPGWKFADVMEGDRVMPK